VRHLRRLLLSSALLLGFVGCSQSPPTLAGGKPVAYWIEALQSHDARLRKKAVFTLGNVGTTDPATLPALLAALRDRDATVRSEAILALVKCGPEAQQALPLLAEMQQRDNDAKVRRYAAKVREKLQSGA
jgi:HEAT repeat protein